MATAVQLPWSTVSSWLERNPFQTAALKSFSPTEETIEGTAEHQTSDGWSRLSVSPKTPLSAVLLAQDTLYAASPTLTRLSLLRDELTDLQEKSMLHLKGRQWPVRKTAEGLAAVGQEEGRSWPEMGWRALCALRECQCILVNEEKKQVTFFPEDVRTWSSEVETLFMDSEVRFLLTPPERLSIGLWLSQQEQSGWSIDYPLADGGMDELKATAAKHNETVPPKITKESLRRRVGRAECVTLFTSWSS